jgi:hypothetical protein
MSAPTKPLIDPKDLIPAAQGLVLGVCLLGLFVLLAIVLGMPLLAETWRLPRV